MFAIQPPGMFIVRHSTAGKQELTVPQGFFLTTEWVVLAWCIGVICMSPTFCAPSKHPTNTFNFDVNDLHHRHPALPASWLFSSTFLHLHDPSST